MYSHCLFCRLLGSTDIQLQEVVSKGKHNVTRTLKGKKGEQLTVCGVSTSYAWGGRDYVCGRVRVVRGCLHWKYVDLPAFPFHEMTVLAAVQGAALALHGGCVCKPRTNKKTNNKHNP